MDTTSGALSRTLHLLAQHQEVQEKLRREVTEARAKTGDLTYDGLVSLPYLDAVCRESLRLYPPVSYLSRTCVYPLVPIIELSNFSYPIYIYVEPGKISSCPSLNP